MQGDPVKAMKRDYMHDALAHKLHDDGVLSQDATMKACRTSMTIYLYGKRASTAGKRNRAQTSLTFDPKLYEKRPPQKGDLTSPHCRSQAAYRVV